MWCDQTDHKVDTDRRAFLFGRRDFQSDEEGATAIEYGLIGGLVGVMLLGSFSFLGGKVNRYFHCARRVVRHDGQKDNSARCFAAGPRDKDLRKEWRKDRRERRREERRKEREQGGGD